MSRCDPGGAFVRRAVTPNSGRTTESADGQSACGQGRGGLVARREVIDLEGFAHGNPIPVAVKIGNMVYSGAVAGTDEQGVTSTDPAVQIEQVFKNVRRIVEKAGGSVADIAKLDV